jgi:methylase of polypeptide subunit release factors
LVLLNIGGNNRIEIPDRAFERVFAFFDAWDWRLDDRPLRNESEINPDVLGYIFEKYINQKQMGAYYTKEDITDYISKNTIIPFLFDRAQKLCANAFDARDGIWKLLREQPDRYIYDAVKHGITVDALEKPPRQLAEPIALPYGIAAGLADVSKRTEWNKTASTECGLPTETWREVVARRKRYEEVHAKLVAGQVTQINDLITLNLDIRQFAQDVLATYEGSDLIAAFYRAIAGRAPENSKEEFEQGLSVLDPTCGSGAFLFAALSVLEPLVETCIERMRSFVEEADRQGRTRSYPAFRRALTEISKHLNDEYFILKTIIIGNLYGVDIMQEATEICKLRLFLKLVAHTERNEGRKNMGLEPLPDIDFNIRAGNTLVGFTSLDEAKRATANKLDWEAGKTLAEIDEGAREADHAYKIFREMQVVHGLQDSKQHEFKSALREQLASLAAKLDRYLAEVYGKDPHKQKEFEAWHKSHQPFHWFTEFYGIIASGGFDVIIGNPPYVEYSKIKDEYSIKNYKTQDCRNLYAFASERSLALLHKNGRTGLIIPVSFASSGAINSLRDVIDNCSRDLWLSHFANRPGQLFEGAQNRLTIFLCGETIKSKQVYSTSYYRWDSRNGARAALFPSLKYEITSTLARQFHGLFPKSGTSESVSILEKIGSQKVVRDFLDKSDSHRIYWVRVPGYFCQFFLIPPKAIPEKGGAERIRGEVNSIALRDSKVRRILHSLLNSSTYYHFFCVYTDGRHINPSDVLDFPINLKDFTPQTISSLCKCSINLELCMIANTTKWRKSGLLIDSVESKKCKSIIDEIDRVLTAHYGFTDEELDFIINYDIKYRMGKDAEETTDQ